MPNTLRKEDSIAPEIAVNQKDRTEVCKELSGLLASTYLLYLKTLYYHWNVTGKHFVGLHQLFQQQYEGLHKAGDVLAERVRALGHFTPGTIAEFLEFSQVKDDARLPASSEKMVENLLKANETCSQQARAVLEVAEKAGDEVTVDMMVARMAAHDKAAWMLRSIME